MQGNIGAPELSGIVADRLCRAMTAKSISRRELEELTGLSQPTVSRYLNGRTVPRLIELIALADALDVSTDWLLGRKGQDPFTSE